MQVTLVFAKFGFLLEAINYDISYIIYYTCDEDMITVNLCL